MRTSHPIAAHLASVLLLAGAGACSAEPAANNNVAGMGGASGVGGVALGGSAGVGGSAGSGFGGTMAGGSSGMGGLAGSAGTSGVGGAPLGGSAGMAGGAGMGGVGMGGVAGSGAGGSAAGGAGGSGGTGGDTAYNPCPTTAGTACKILPLGDSITEGCCTGDFGGYRIELFRQSIMNQKALTFVGDETNGPTMVDTQPFPRDHEGHGGFTIDTGPGTNRGISGDITNSALSDYSPHIVLLKIGTNDINGNISVDQAPTRLGNLIDDIIEGAPDALLVVSTIIPSQNDGLNSRIETYNNAMQGVVEERMTSGAHILFIDNYSVFTANANYKQEWLGDNLHPNDAGYAVLGQSFYELIEEFLPPVQ